MFSPRGFVLSCLSFVLTMYGWAQINTDRVLLMGRNAMYYEDYVLAIQRFNMVINAKPWLGEPYFYRGLAKFYLEDFSGAEIDCGSALERNPYVANHFVLRALCRVNQDRYALAEEDYRSAIAITPMDHNCWHNMVLCQLELKEYQQADSSLDVMIRYWPKEAMQYTLKAQVALACADTIRGLEWLERALEVNPYEGAAWSMKGVVCSQKGRHSEAEEAFDKAIVQQPRNAGLYINRALARYELENLRGAMSDYDTALEMEDGNYLAHFNRGLLRAQVGEDNRAIEDFNFVLEQEPDNMIALYNRALLLDNTGDYKGAIRDISAVIQEYPQFWAGYKKRAEIRRKVGDVYGAERDEFKIFQAQMAVNAGTYKSSGKTRKKSENNIEKYNKLVEEDTHEPENEYASDYRGRVQNRQTELKTLPNYVLTYYKNSAKIQEYVAYCRDVEALNQSHLLPLSIYMSNLESNCTEDRLQEHFQWISELSDKLDAQPGQISLLLHRSFDYYHVRDFENAIADLNEILAKDDSYVMALFLRAQVRCAQLDASGATMQASELRLGYLMVLQDLTKCVEMNPEMSYAHYNRGNVFVRLADYSAAVHAYDEAVKLDAKFPDAFFNRGVAYLLNNEIDNGLSDLSQAGELGLYAAYNLIKRYSAKKQK